MILKKISFCLFVFLFFFILFKKIFLEKSLFLLSKNISFPFFPFLFSFPNSDSFFLEKIFFFHDIYLMSILNLISFLVLVIFFSISKLENFNFKLNHDFSLELFWIFFPLFILLMIGIPSLKMLYEMEESFQNQLITIKTTGYQWFWTYDMSSFFSSEKGEYVEESYMKGEEESDSLDNIFTDSELFIPPFMSFRNLISSGDVMHSWTLPGMGLKADAIPGRLNQMNLFLEEKEKIFLGQCSELCGVNHSFMPIVLKPLKEINL